MCHSEALYILSAASRRAGKGACTREIERGKRESKNRKSIGYDTTSWPSR